MKSRGVNHFGLVTHDIDATIEFYQGLLGFEPMAYYLREVGESRIRQVFFDLGNGQSLEFAQFHDVEAVPENFDAGINGSLGMGGLGVGPVHFAFDVESMEELEARKKRLEGAGFAVIGPLDLDWVQSIYFVDPNGVQLEFAYTARSAPGAAYMEPAQSAEWQRLKTLTADRH